MRKIFTFLFAALMSVGMGWAQEESLLTTITLGSSSTPSANPEGVATVSAVGVDSRSNRYGWELYGDGSITIEAQNGYTITRCVFRQNEKEPITVSAAPFAIHWVQGSCVENNSRDRIDGVTSVEVYGYQNYASEPEPEPAEVTVVFAANDKTVERTVTLPHTFKCNSMYGIDHPDELDNIMVALYNYYYGCGHNINASGSDQVEVGTDESSNDYITIKGIFEGTATVTGNYGTADTDGLPYTLTVSIKGDELSAIDNTAVSEKATKRIVNGQLLIEKNGKIYDLTGAQVR